MRAVIPVLIATVLSGWIAIQPALADGRHRGGGLRLDAPYLPPGREAREDNGNGRDNDQRGRMSPGEAAQRAQNINGGGRVLSVEQAGNGYRVKLLRDGEVRVVFVQ